MPETSSIHVFLSRAGGETLHLHNLLMTFGMLKKKGKPVKPLDSGQVRQQHILVHNSIPQIQKHHRCIFHYESESFV